MLLARSISLGVASGFTCTGASRPPAKAAPRPSLPATAASAATPPAAAPSLRPAAGEPPPQPEDSPGFAETMARLRPPGTQAALAALAAAPADAEAYAQAALAFAATDAPAMTLIYGMSYQALGGGASTPRVAEALSRVLRERIVAQRDEQSHSVKYNVRLAPGQMPQRKNADGTTQGPVAHVFEALFSPALTGASPPWTVEQFYDALSSWVGVVAAHGTPLDERLELHGWLVALAKSGHLEAYCYALLGPAFPAELKQFRRENAAVIKAYAAYQKDVPLRPTRPPMPDDL